MSEKTTKLGITDRSKQKLVKSVQNSAVDGQLAVDAAPKAGRSHSNSL